jgi:DNA ligase (NAD+)
VGQYIANVLSRKFGTFDAIMNVNRNELEKIRGIGPEISSSIVEFFSQEKNKKVLKRLMDAGIEIEAVSKPERDLSLQGKTFVFTGELKNYTRSEAEGVVENLGARATSSVSGQTDYVVAGKEPGSKLDEAKKRGVKILYEKDFKKLIKR